MGSISIHPRQSAKELTDEDNLVCGALLKRWLRALVAMNGPVPTDT